MPDVSVTIAPTGHAYQVAREIIDALHSQCPEADCAQFEPHVTLQLSKDVPDLEVVVREIEAIASRTPSFEIRFGAIGSFQEPFGVHVDLEKDAPLVALYLAVKRGLDQLGLNTYDYDAELWHPHLTLSCRHWSPDELARIRAMFPRLNASFQAERLRVNRFESADGAERWVTIRDVPLTGDAGDTMVRAD